MAYTTRSADGTTIVYERTGDGPALILVGGALGNRHSAGPFVPPLAEQFSVISYDRRGRGDSGDTPPYAPACEIEDLKALIDANGGSASVYGHSSGGVLALETAAAGAAITRLAVYEPPYLTRPPGDDTAGTTLAKINAALAAGDRATAVETFMRSTGAPFDPASREQPWWPTLEAVAHTLPYDMAIVGDGKVPAERLAKINIPTLGLSGGASPEWARNSVAAVTAAIPGATSQVLEGQTHGVAPEVVAPVLISFFG
jgi:pimeloyl-ACP methyl ester carboxylesterase